MSENMRIYEASRTVPPEALKEIPAGRLKGMSDINPMWRIKKLTELYGPCGIGWKVEITDRRLEQGAGVEIVCFVDINLYVKHDGEWSAPIPGMGGSSFVTQERNGVFTSDECYKMAYTDAISVACKSLGFAADVYYAKDRTKYTANGEAPTEAAQPHQPSQPSQASRQPQNASTGRVGSAAPINNKSRAINLMHELKWDWNTLGSFASDALSRKIGKVLNDIKSEDEWKIVADAMEATRAAG